MVLSHKCVICGRHYQTKRSDSLTCCSRCRNIKSTITRGNFVLLATARSETELLRCIQLYNFESKDDHLIYIHHGEKDIAYIIRCRAEKWEFYCSRRDENFKKHPPTVPFIRMMEEIRQWQEVQRRRFLNFSRRNFKDSDYAGASGG